MNNKSSKINANSKKTVLITGASSGIGKYTAQELSKEGFKVIAAVRKTSDAENIKIENPLIAPILIDVNDIDSIKKAALLTDEMTCGEGIFALINNAGIAVAGPVEFLPVERLRLQLETNVIGQIAVTQKFLPLIRKGCGRIVNISSISGFTAFPFKGAYAASKFAMEALSDSLRRELKPWQVPVSIIEPGIIKTPIWEKSINMVEDIVSEMPPEAEKYYGSVYRNLLCRIMRKVEQKGADPSEVYSAIRHALVSKQPKIRYLVGKDAKFLSGLITLPDRIVDWFICRRAGLCDCEFPR